MIVDARGSRTGRGTVLTGSHNWSASAENSNNENTLIVHDADVANQYLQEFAARYTQFGGTDSVHVSDAGRLHVAARGVAGAELPEPVPRRDAASSTRCPPRRQVVAAAVRRAGPRGAHAGERAPGPGPLRGDVERPTVFRAASTSAAWKPAAKCASRRCCCCASGRSPAPPEPAPILPGSSRQRPRGSRFARRPPPNATPRAG